MKIKEKLDFILKNMSYNFCDIDFKILNTDLIRIYESDTNSLPLFQCKISDSDSIPEKYLEKIYKKEDLYKIASNKFAICFYLNKECIDLPVSAKVSVK